ncbi:MAG TPA: hypothetical protein VFR47_19425 [Anaerolineales bacterium]|nr:hypothetical protein [Anaerolineales bacterium]
MVAKRLPGDLIQFNDTVSLILDRRQQRLTRTFAPVVAGRISILHLRMLSKTIEAANAVLASRGLQPWTLVDDLPARLSVTWIRAFDEGRQEKKETSDPIIRILIDGLNDPLLSVSSQSMESTN